MLRLGKPKQERNMPIATINPTTGETLEIFTPLTDTEIQNKVQIAAEAFRQYRRTSCAERSQQMRRMAELLEAEQETLALTMTLEVGKTLQSSRDEVGKCVACCRFYADNAECFLSDRPIAVPGTRASIRYQPLGPVLALMPWNFPLWQVFRFAVPALMAGNVGLLKHAENVPRCARAIEDLFHRAGFSEGVFQTLLITLSQLDPLYEDPRIVAVTLTGSEAAGRKVGELAGRNLKKTVLELGGSDPFVVLASADVEEAAKTAVRARTINNGQSCIAAKRFIIVEAVAEKFMEMFLAGMKALRVGDPMDPVTDIGPLATPRLLENLDRQVRESVAAGARVLLGGERLNRLGNFYAPTILTDIPKASPAYSEELFGPVALLFRVPDLDAAIALANDTPFGLGCSIWTHDEAEQERCIEEIEAGMVFINQMVASDPRLPFGGIKNSGHGRELSEEGIREFVNCKTVSLK
jgi:succinate-semialdehyde dehydrogenase/glutarate-semialdehyde dehydrogenase